jgi:bifunctional enzyme CysN/CysC/sulfate adenylyltransferase subunit 1
VSSILTYDGELKSAHSPQSVTLTLDDEIDISRGEMLVAADAEPPFQTTAFAAKLVWMVEQPLREGDTYLLKHTTRTVRASVRRIRNRVDVLTGEDHPAAALQMNDIAEVELHTNLPLFFDTYEESRPLGSLILIDPVTNATVAAAMICAALDGASGQVDTHSAFIWTRGNPTLVDETVRALRSENRAAVNIDDPSIPDSALPAVARALQLADVVAVSARPDLAEYIVDSLKEIAAAGWIEGEADLREWRKKQS